jgi:hypothetical protein
MKALLNTTHKLFPRNEVDAVANELKAGDPDWDYRVIHDPKGTGLSFIEVYDEDGEYVSRV